MSAERDADRVVEYRKNPRRLLFAAVWLCFAGALIFWLFRGEAETPPVAWLATAAGMLFGLWFLWRIARPGAPVLELRPQGIAYRLGRVGAFFIPWQAVEGVDTVDFTAGRARRRTRFTAMTAVLVSEDFYAKYIHKDAALQRGPYWDCFFRPRGELVEIVFHHEWFAVRPEEVRGPVEARWRVFRHRQPEVLPDPAAQTLFGRDSAPLVYGGSVLNSPRAAAAVLPPLLGTLAIAVHALVS